MAEIPSKRSSGPSAAREDDPPLTAGEAQLLGEVYASLHARLARHRDDAELVDIGRAVYAGSARARAMLRTVGLPRIRGWLLAMRAELVATGHFTEASHVKDLASLLQSWERRGTTR